MKRVGALFADKALRELWELSDRVVGGIRREALRASLQQCGAEFHIYHPFQVTGADRIRIGDNVHINRGAFIRGEGGLTIEDNVHIARNVVIYTVNHDYQGAALPYDETYISKPVVIGKNAWIGMNCIVIPGAQIGEGAIIAAGTVVSGIIEALAIVGGGKCGKIKDRDKDHYERLERAGDYGGVAGRRPPK